MARRRTTNRVPREFWPIRPEEFVTVEFKHPVLGTDPVTGREVISLVHKVASRSCWQDAHNTKFVDFKLVIAQWPTESIAVIRWPQSSGGGDSKVKVDAGSPTARKRVARKSRAGTNRLPSRSAPHAGRDTSGARKRSSADPEPTVKDEAVDPLVQAPYVDPDPLPARAGASWSNSDQIRLRQAHQDGATLSELSRHHERHVSEIIECLVRTGVLGRPGAERG
jgi:hypothetical protein